MTPQCALQMRATFWDRHFDAGDRFVLRKGTKIQHTSEEDDEGGSEESHGHANIARKMRMILLENDDT